MSQLARLTKPFPKQYVKTKPNSSAASYVEHPVVEQALLATLGPYTFRKVEILRGHVGPKEATKNQSAKPALENAIVGVVAALTVNIDGREVTVEECGDCEQPHNWDTDGKRLKDAMSDAFKRCCMRIGLGLHLWVKDDDDYFLHDSLTRSSDASPGDVPPVPRANIEGDRGGVPPSASGAPQDEPGETDVGEGKPAESPPAAADVGSEETTESATAALRSSWWKLAQFLGFTADDLSAYFKARYPLYESTRDMTVDELDAEIAAFDALDELGAQKLKTGLSEGTYKTPVVGSESAPSNGAQLDGSGPSLDETTRTRYRRRLYAVAKDQTGQKAEEVKAYLIGRGLIKESTNELDEDGWKLAIAQYENLGKEDTSA